MRVHKLRDAGLVHRKSEVAGEKERCGFVAQESFPQCAEFRGWSPLNIGAGEARLSQEVRPSFGMLVFLPLDSRSEWVSEAKSCEEIAVHAVGDDQRSTRVGDGTQLPEEPPVPLDSDWVAQKVHAR